MNKVFVINEGSRDFYKIKLRWILILVVFNVLEFFDIFLWGELGGDSFVDFEVVEEFFFVEDGFIF